MRKIKVAFLEGVHSLFLFICWQTLMLVKIGVSGEVDWDKCASEPPPFLSTLKGTHLSLLGFVFICKDFMPLTWLGF